MEAVGYKGCAAALLPGREPPYHLDLVARALPCGNTCFRSLMLGVGGPLPRAFCVRISTSSYRQFASLVTSSPSECLGLLPIRVALSLDWYFKSLLGAV